MTDNVQEKKDSKSKALTAAVVVILCTIFVVGFIIGLNSVLAMEGAFPPAELTAGKVFLPDTEKSSAKEKAKFTNEDAVKYISGLIDAALTNEAKISSGRAYGISGDSVKTTGNDKFTEAVKFVADDINDSGKALGKAMFSDFEQKSTSFGEDMSNILRKPVITADDIDSFDISYIYYECPTCGETSDTPVDTCEACGSNYGYNEAYRDDYKITVHLKNNENILNANFAPRTTEEIEALLADGTKDCINVSEIKREYKELNLIITVDRVSNKIKYLSFEKKLVVSLDAEFKGEWAMLGKENISFELTQNDKFDFVWPALELDNHTLEMEPKGSDNLLATLTCDKPTEMTVTWTSSNPEIVEVDDEGYLKACKKDGGSAIITASYEFNGKTYSDECEVKVLYSVESTAMKKNKVKLNAGETYQLELKFDPKKATVKTAKWYTGDEKIATVDENGVVTAVAKGVVTVYSLSDDGYFKSSCEVTVE